MPIYYIDTCSLKWRYLNGSPTTDVNTIMDDLSNKVFTSELTILEWSNAVASVCRQGIIDYATFKNNELALMTDIVNDRLLITPMTRSIERARYLIEYVGVKKKLALRTGDSLHIVTALDVATTVHETVTFLTSDKTLAKIIQDVDTFTPLLTSIYLAP